MEQAQQTRSSSEFSTLGEIIYPGRPDFVDHGWGVTYAKSFPQYVYSLGRNGALIHKVNYVSIRWWRGSMDRMIRLRKPCIIAETICGMAKFVQTDEQQYRSNRLRASFCEIPKPDAVLCGRCHGEHTNFPRKDPTAKERLKLAKVKLGCIARW